MAMTTSASVLTICASAVVLVSCAPLTQPMPPPPPEAADEAASPPPASVLECYLQDRQTPAAADRYRPWIAVLPMADDSGFEEDVWDLENDVPRLLSEVMARSVAWHVVPYGAVMEVVSGHPGRWEDGELRRIGSILQADLVLVGTLLEYNLGRLHLGDPLVGGYKSYTGVADAELTVLDAAELSQVGSIHARDETVDRDLGLDLMGRPRKQDIGFFALDQMVYGSEEFRRTALGQATIKVMEELLQQLAGLILPRAIQTVSGQPEILSVFGDEIYVNVGSENGVHRGYRFAVYPGEDGQGEADPEQRLAVVEVREVVSSRVSRVQIVSGEGIAVGDRIELIMAEPE